MSPTTPTSATDPRPARVGIQVPPQHATYAEIRRTVATLEELGADVVLNWDHFFPLSGDRTGCTSSAGRCSAPGRRPPRRSRSARS